MSDIYKKSKSFLGTGWAFPPSFNEEPLVGIDMVANEIDIKESLEILLNTNPGERIMLPEYGCELQKYVFDVISNTRLHYLKNSIKTAIVRYEPRILVNNITVSYTHLTLPTICSV